MQGLVAQLDAARQQQVEGEKESRRTVVRDCDLFSNVTVQERLEGEVRELHGSQAQTKQTAAVAAALAQERQKVASASAAEVESLRERSAELQNTVAELQVSVCDVPSICLARVWLCDY